MEAGQIMLLDPRGVADVKRIVSSPRPKSVAGLTIGVIDNTKPNFDLFMDTVQEQLLSVFKAKEVVRYRKPGRTKGVSSEILADIKNRCDFVITGLGD